MECHTLTLVRSVTNSFIHFEIILTTANTSLKNIRNIFMRTFTSIKMVNTQIVRYDMKPEVS